MVALPAAAVAVDAGALPLGGGLLALVRPALDGLVVGGVLAIRSTAPSVREDLPAWCRLEGHTYVGCEPAPPDGHRHLIARGALGTLRGAPESAVHLRPAGGRLGAAALLAAVPMPATAEPSSGFAPRGAQVEAGGPSYPFTLLERERVAPVDVAMFYDQAVAAQWDGAGDIAWGDVPELSPPLAAAVGQIMTFLAENELSALYVPARFLPRIHPAYVETALFLATQLADEARHIDVFLKRARCGGSGAGVSSAITAHSLRALLEPEDFTEATFLLSVLGEGTFLDLLRFIEDYAPDPVTAEIVRRARADEARHVHFGMAHVRQALAHDPTQAARLEAAIRRRAAALAGVGGVPARIQDALTMLAAGDTTPVAIARGHDAFRALLDVMHEARTKRLLHTGFSATQAAVLSELHTPNFM